jgi:hypothetical protein
MPKIVKKPQIPAGTFTIKGRLMFIGLTRGRVAVVDRDLVGAVGAQRWHAKIDKRKRRVYARSRIGMRLVLLHRFVAELRTGGHTPLIDHKNLDGLDCRWDNLREASIDENNRNRPANRNCRSGYRGVCQLKSGRWCASIQHDGTRFSLGTYDTKEQAARAYRAAAKAHHREFAHTP